MPDGSSSERFVSYCSSWSTLFFNKLLRKKTSTSFPTRNSDPKVVLHELLFLLFLKETLSQFNLSSTEPSANDELLSHSLGAAKVIIRPVSQLSTLAPLQSQQQENDNKADGCKCEPINSCPIELMDFRFAVSCEYGTVRCCRPLEPVLIKETTTSKTMVVTPASTLKWPRKSCRCKPRKECDEQAIDRKSEIGCSAGNVRCCETGTNTGNSKTEASPDAHVLGGNGFRPVQLPFLKMPQPADEVKKISNK